MPNRAQPVGGSRGSVMATMTVATFAAPARGVLRGGGGKAGDDGGSAKDGEAARWCAGRWVLVDNQRGNDDGLRTWGGNVGSTGIFKVLSFFSYYFLFFWCSA
jgi:hypothetical protein